MEFMRSAISNQQRNSLSLFIESKKVFKKYFLNVSIFLFVALLTSSAQKKINQLIYLLVNACAKTRIER